MIKYFLLLFAALFFISCSKDDDSSDNPVVIDSPIVGTWTKSYSTTISNQIFTYDDEVKFESNGNVSFKSILNSLAPIQSYSGKFTVDGNNITITGGSCTTEGKYSFSVNGNNLTITLDDEDCISSGRMGILGEWSK